jgi:hypothetical protein
MYLSAGMHCNLDDLTAIYADRKVAAAILEDAKKHETVDMIESGACHLPEPHEAREFTRQQGIEVKFGKTPIGKAMSDNPLLHNYLVNLEDRLAALEHSPTHAAKKGGS